MRVACTFTLPCLLVLSACGNPLAPIQTFSDAVGNGTRIGLAVATVPSRAFHAAGLGIDSPLPAAEAQCRRDLRRLKVQFTPVPSVRQGGSCGIVNPVRVTALSKRIRLEPAATMNCPTALAAARWAHREVAPAARRRYGSNVSAVKHMSAYSCRTIRGTGRVSEHGKGNALDVGAVVLANGRTIKVRRKGFFAFREKSFMRAIREGACRHFTTVLGPGSDRDHADHFHFDLKPRRSGRYCDL